MALTAQLHAAGPAHVYIGPQAGAGVTPIYFGTTAEPPFIVVQKSYEGAPNDIGGQVPFDVSYQGQLGFLSLDFTRWSNVAEGWVSEYPHASFARRGAAASPVLGVDLAGDIGALATTEGRGFMLWVAMPFGAPAAAGPGALATSKAAMLGDPSGYRFLSAHPVGDPIKTRVGTGVKRLNVNFLCTRVYVPNTGDQVLFDQNLAGLPRPD